MNKDIKEKLTPEAFAGKYGAERIVRLLPLLESYGYATITHEGQLMLAEAKRISSAPFGDQLDPADRPAANRLREWRRLKAREDNVSAYIILSNKKLFALAAAHPATALELAFLGIPESSSTPVSPISSPPAAAMLLHNLPTYDFTSRRYFIITQTGDCPHPQTTIMQVFFL